MTLFSPSCVMKRGKKTNSATDQRLASLKLTEDLLYVLLQPNLSEILGCGAQSCSGKRACTAREWTFKKPTISLKPGRVERLVECFLRATILNYSVYICSLPLGQNNKVRIFGQLPSDDLGSLSLFFAVIGDFNGLFLLKWSRREEKKVAKLAKLQKHSLITFTTSSIPRARISGVFFNVLFSHRSMRW